MNNKTTTEIREVEEKIKNILTSFKIGLDEQLVLPDKAVNMTAETILTLIRQVEIETREETLREAEDCFDWLPDKHSIQGKALKEELAKLKEKK